MPLNKGKSNAARSQNIATEIRAGRSPEQAAAIAYSVQRKAKKKKPTPREWLAKRGVH